MAYDRVILLCLSYNRKCNNKLIYNEGYLNNQTRPMIDDVCILQVWTAANHTKMCFVEFLIYNYIYGKFKQICFNTNLPRQVIKNKQHLIALIIIKKILGSSGIQSKDLKLKLTCDYKLEEKTVFVLVYFCYSFSTFRILLLMKTFLF